MGYILGAAVAVAVTKMVFSLFSGAREVGTAPREIFPMAMDPGSQSAVSWTSGTEDGRKTEGRPKELGGAVEPTKSVVEFGDMFLKMFAAINRDST